MNLQEQKIFVPVYGKDVTHDSTIKIDGKYQYIPLKEESKICLSKEELESLLRHAFYAGKSLENAAWNNQEYMMNLPEVGYDEYISSLNIKLK